MGNWASRASISARRAIVLGAGAQGGSGIGGSFASGVKSEQETPAV